MGWAWLLWLLVPLVVLAVLAGLWLLVRARSLSRVVGSFDCAWRAAGAQDWVGGVAIYGVDRLDWYRLVSVRPGPARRWPRGELAVEPGRQPVPGSESNAVGVRCHAGTEDFDLAMEPAALDGLRGWLESSPPVDRGIA